jgi:hypothetical protein
MDPSTFIKATKQGKNQAWRYIVGLSVILFFWLILGSVPYLIAIVLTGMDGDPASGLDMTTGRLTGIDPLLGGYLLPNLSFPLFLAGIVLAVRVLHRRPIRSLVTPRETIAWQRVWQGFWVWGLLALSVTAVEILLHPGSFRWNPVGLGRYLLFAALALVFTPLQTTTEELFFRGYLLQAVGRLLRTPIVAAIINGVLFMVPHLANPEVSAGPVLLMLYYFGMGAFFSWITLRDGTAELALGAHAANNLFVALLINFEGSALQTPALVMSDRLDPLFNLVTFVVMAIVFSITLLGMAPRRSNAALGEADAV